jgi:hypothetical protein
MERDEAATLRLLAPSALTVALSAIDRLNSNHVEQIILVESIGYVVVFRRLKQEHACPKKAREIGVSDHVRLSIGKLNTKRLERLSMKSFKHLLITHRSSLRFCEL